MAWDNVTHEIITIEKLLLLPPDRVYEELKQYGEFLKQKSFLRDKELEQTLLDRKDKLINLALAQFAGTREIVLGLYKSTQEKTESDRDYNLALRLACLSNVVTSRFSHDFLDEIDVKELIDAKDESEIAVYLANPTAPEGQLENFFRRKGNFENLDEAKWIRFIHYVAKNPRLNDNKYDDYEPDLKHWDLHRAIFEMLETAPVTIHSLRAIYNLLHGLNPKHTLAPEEIQHVLDRWRTIEVNDSKGNLTEGYYTSLNLRDEFLCLIASLYGKFSKKNELNVLGSLTSNDIILRCSYYGKADMKLKEMQAAYNRDKEIFTYAALNNFNLYYGQQRRKFLEECIGGGLKFIYKNRCDQLHATKRFFDPRPLSDEFWDFEDNPPIKKKSDELIEIEKITRRQDSVEKQLVQLKGYLFLGTLIILIAIAYYAY